MSGEYVELPVLVDFEASRQVGTLRILKSALPPTPHFVFALGYRQQVDANNYTPVAISAVADTEYKQYLNKFDSGPKPAGNI